MIRNFEPPTPTEPEAKDRLQWLPALNAGLIAGGVLLVVPRGTPWSSLDFFAPVVMGRLIPQEWNIPLAGCFVLHLAVSILYSFIISRVVAGVTQLWAVMAGGIVGLFLYLVNLGIVTFLFPQLRGNEVSAAFTHLVFGLIAGGAYRGLLRRRVVAPSGATVPDPTQH